MYLDSYNNNTYIKCLDLLQTGQDKIKNYLEKVSANSNFKEIDFLIEIYDSIFDQTLLKDNIQFKTERIFKPHYVVNPSVHSKANSYWHITLKVESEEMSWLDNIYESQLSNVLKLYIHTFSKVNHFLISLSSRQFEKFNLIFDKVAFENQKYIDSSINREEFEKREKLENTIIKNFPYEGFYHMTDYSNVKDILKYGLLSHNEAHKLGLVKVDISNKQVNDRRNRHVVALKGNIHDYTPLYINPQNPMLHNKQNVKDQLVMFEVTPHILLEKDTFFTDGNAASIITEFYSDLTDINKLDWNVIRKRPGFHQDWTRKMNSEVLVKDIVSHYYINKIIVPNKKIFNEMLKLFPNHLGINIHHNEEIFNI